MMIQEQRLQHHTGFYGERKQASAHASGMIRTSTRDVGQISSGQPAGGGWRMVHSLSWLNAAHRTKKCRKTKKRLIRRSQRHREASPRTSGLLGKPALVSSLLGPGPALLAAAGMARSIPAITTRNAPITGLTTYGQHGRAKDAILRTKKARRTDERSGEACRARKSDML